MSVALFALGVWLVASLPIGLLLGRACGLNELSRDEGELPVGSSTRSSPTTLDGDRRTGELAAA